MSDKLLVAFQMRRELLEAGGFVGIRVIGATDSKETLELREFCHKKKVPHKFEDIDEESGRASLEALGFGPEQAPVIACSRRAVAHPSLAEFAEALGINREIPDECYDVTIIGAGPAGLAAAVYGGCEGLKTLLLDRVGPGGQTGPSSKIENSLGFPAGISGADLGNRGYLQAIKFGVEFRAPVSVRRVRRHESGQQALELCTGQIVRSRAVLIATGASYRRLPVDNCERFEGLGVYYAATSVEARVCRGETAIVVGGGNSAGQAAMYLAQRAAGVKLVLRGDDLGKRMSDYLRRRIDHAPNIEVLLDNVVEWLDGGKHLAHVVVRNTRTGEGRRIDCKALFSFVGARPHTEWLDETFAMDERGFLRTGADIAFDPRWPAARPPCELETTHPGVFAAGDVRPLEPRPVFTRESRPLKSNSYGRRPRRRGDRGGPSGQRLDARGRRAGAGRPRVSLVGLRIVQHPAPLRCNAEPGRSRSSSRRAAPRGAAWRVRAQRNLSHPDGTRTWQMPNAPRPLAPSTNGPRPAQDRHDDDFAPRGGAITGWHVPCTCSPRHERPFRRRHGRREGDMRWDPLFRVPRKRSRTRGIAVEAASRRGADRFAGESELPVDAPVAVEDVESLSIGRSNELALVRPEAQHYVQSLALADVAIHLQIGVPESAPPPSGPARSALDTRGPARRSSSASILRRAAQSDRPPVLSTHSRCRGGNPW